MVFLYAGGSAVVINKSKIPMEMKYDRLKYDAPRGEICLNRYCLITFSIFDMLKSFSNALRFSHVFNTLFKSSGAEAIVIGLLEIKLFLVP